MDLERIENILRMVLLHPNSREYKTYYKALTDEEKEIVKDLKKTKRRGVVRSGDVLCSIISGC